MEGMGNEKLHFALLELTKHQKGPLGQSVSTNFVDNVANSQMHQYIAFLNLNFSSFLRTRHLYNYCIFRSNKAI